MELDLVFEALLLALSIIMLIVFAVGAIIAIDVYGVPAIGSAISWINYQSFTAKYSTIGEKVPFSFGEVQKNCSTLIYKLHDVGSVWLDNYRNVYDKNNYKIQEQRGDWYCLKEVKQ